MQRPVAQPNVLERIGDPFVTLALFRRYLVDVVNVVNSATQGVGATLVSATTIKPTNAIHHVSGTATVQTIVAPPGFTGPLFLISDGGFSAGTSGNIGLAGTTIINAVTAYIYDGVKWYPL